MDIKQLNNTKKEKLQAISGIGEVTSELIISKAPFDSWEDLQELPYVTGEVFQRIKEVELCGRCSKIKSECNCGRPTKLTGNFVKVAREVIEEDINAIIYTDKELLEEINSRLPKEERIGKRTFPRWKRKIKESKVESLPEEAQQFWHLYQKALRQQKHYLFTEFREDEKKWQKWAWIIERKFDDWNLKQKTEHSGDLPTPIIQVERE